MLSVILGLRDKIMNKTNIVLLSRNLKIKVSVVNFIMLCYLLCDVMLFKYRYVVDVL